MRYPVCLESDTTGQSRSHVQGLPGCWATGREPGDALEGLFVAIPEYWAWLGRHGLPVAPPDGLGEVTLAVVEIVRDHPPGASPLFTYEQAPVTPAFVVSCLRRLTYSRSDLLGALAGLPVATFVPGPEGTVGGLVMHLAATERRLTRLLGPGSRLKPAADPLARLANMRASAIHQITQLPDTPGDHIVSRGGESWNLRKVLRRLIEHEREHTAEIVALRGQEVPQAS
ncbi:MAG TPA: DinB family protein [Chloroflexia bacterium]|nr:DinB family protein [Chloroflexia bacterium]